MKKKILSVLCILVLFVAAASTIVSATGVNYGTSTHPNSFTYNGYVQCQPSYNDNNRHAARGRFRYTNGLQGTKTYYTAYGSSYTDSNIYKKSATYYDTIDPNAPKVQFTYNFDFVPHADAVNGVWPF